MSVWTVGAQVGVRGGDGWLVIAQQSPGRPCSEPRPRSTFEVPGESPGARVCRSTTLVQVESERSWPSFRHVSKCVVAVVATHRSKQVGRPLSGTRLQRSFEPTALRRIRHRCATGGCVSTCRSQQVERPLSGMDQRLQSECTRLESSGANQSGCLNQRRMVPFRGKLGAIALIHERIIQRALAVWTVHWMPWQGSPLPRLDVWWLHDKCAWWTS